MKFTALTVALMSATSMAQQPQMVDLNNLADESQPSQLRRRQLTTADLLNSETEMERDLRWFGHGKDHGNDHDGILHNKDHDGILHNKDHDKGKDDEPEEPAKSGKRGRHLASATTEEEDRDLGWFGHGKDHGTDHGKDTDKGHGKDDGEEPAKSGKRGRHLASAATEEEDRDLGWFGHGKDHGTDHGKDTDKGHGKDDGEEPAKSGKRGRHLAST